MPSPKVNRPRPRPRPRRHPRWSMSLGRLLHKLPPRLPNVPLPLPPTFRNAALRHRTTQNPPTADIPLPMAHEGVTSCEPFPTNDVVSIDRARRRGRGAGAAPGRTIHKGRACFHCVCGDVSGGRVVSQTRLGWGVESAQCDPRMWTTVTSQ
jgi:hypothetical protein